MKTMEEIKNSPEMAEIIERAKFISSFGGVFEFRMNRYQEDKTIKLTKYIIDKDDEIVVLNTRNFLKISDLYLFLNKGVKLIKDDLFEIVKTIPNTWDYKGKSYKLEYNDIEPKRVYKLDLPFEMKYGVSYWMDEEFNVYKRNETLNEFNKRIVQVNASGGEWLNFNGKSVYIDTLKTYKTNESEVM